MEQMTKEEHDSIKARLIDVNDSMAFLRYETKWHTSHNFEHPPARRDAIDTINRYVLNGHVPGEFIGAILCNDLSSSFKNADDDNLKRIFALVSYIYNYIPMNAHGSLARVNAWLARFNKEL